MRRQIQHAGLCMALGLACYGALATQPLTTTQRVQAIQHTDLPQAKAALQSHLQQCDTQLAVLHARRAMAMAEEGSDSSVWFDMEVLTAQCHSTAQDLRANVEKLETELKQLQPAPVRPRGSKP